MKTRLTPVALAAATLFATFAQAQDTSPDAAPDTERAEAAKEEQAESVLPVVIVEGRRETGYAARETSTATRTDTPLLDVPQSITVITRELVEDQAMLSIGDAIRYVPGASMAQGEGNRETPILRGNSTTSDFFLNGLRDDVQYFRDLYNIDRIEVLKGPNAMIFGRGGVGGVINRATRRADWQNRQELTLQGGTDDLRRVSGDVGRGFNEHVAGRVAAVYEDSDSYRDEVTLERYGINPTLALRTGANTRVQLGYEYFHDERIADRGVPSFNGKPFKTDESTFFGSPDESPTGTELNSTSLSIDHLFDNGLSLRNSTMYGDYAKYYQNVFASSAVRPNVDTGELEVTLGAYKNATDRQNLFNQTDLVFKLETGSVTHTLLGGFEFGRQSTENVRKTGRFADGADADADPDTSFVVSADSPTVRRALVDFISSGSDADNESTTRIAAVYVQDQVQLGPRFQAVLGVRYDHFEVDFENRRPDVDPADREIETDDDLVSPRAGLIYKPVEPVSIYVSYTLSYLPRAGEQLSSLSPSNKALDPEEFENYEVGAKWDVRDDFAITAAVYQLDRSKVLLANPVPGGLAFLGDGSRTKGVELGIGGNITKAWSIAGGYAYQDGELTGTANATTAVDGATLAQLPKNTISLWNRYDFTPVWGVGLGVYRRGDMYSSTSNTVKLDGYTRVDGAVYWTPSRHWQAQVNLENLLDKEYYLNAHNDNNILPGSPLAVRASVTARF